MEIPVNNDIWYAVVNIFAASKKAVGKWNIAEQKLREDGIDYVAEATGHHGNARTLTRDACVKGYRKFIAVGGDGTVHDVLEGIMLYLEKVGEESALSDFTLAVIPVGSGNDWIKTAGVPNDVVKAASLFRTGRVSRQDVVKVSLLDPETFPQEKVLKASFMANVGGVGLDAMVCKMVNAEKRRGKRGKRLYVSALLYHIIHRVPAFARVICDGEQVFAGAYLSMAFGIGRYSGGGMRQTPAAVMDDGLLDMTIIPDLPIMKIAVEAPKLFTGKFLTVSELVTSRSRSIIVVPYDESLPCAHVCGGPVEVDGEVVGNAPVKFEVLPSQLKVLTL
jgi:diacylglycerol kinase family enzyme